MRSRSWLGCLKFGKSANPVEATHIMSKTLPILLLSAALAGCASHAEPPIPSRGDVVAQGAGQLSFRSPGPGLVSVYDVNDNSIVNTSAVENGSVVSINPTAMNITVTDA